MGGSPDEKKAEKPVQRSASEKNFEHRNILHMINTEVGPFVEPKVKKVNLGMQPANNHKPAKKLDPNSPPSSSLGVSQSEKGFELPMSIATMKRVPRPVVDIKSKFIKVDFKKFSEEIKERDKARAEFIAQRNAKRAEEEKAAKVIDAEKRAVVHARVAAEKKIREDKQAEELAAAKELIKQARAGGA